MPLLEDMLSPLSSRHVVVVMPLFRDMMLSPPSWRRVDIVVMPLFENMMLSSPSWRRIICPFDDEVVDRHNDDSEGVSDLEDDPIQVQVEYYSKLSQVIVFFFVLVSMF